MKLQFISLALKNVFRQKKRSFTLGINYAVVAAILVLLLAFSKGAVKNISESLTSATAGHITITGQFAKDGKIFNGLLRRDDIVSAVKKTFGEDNDPIVRYAQKSNVYFNGLSKRLSFTGIYPETDTNLGAQASYVSGSWKEFAADPNGALMPASEAEYYGFKVGDEIVLSARTRFGAFNTGILVIRGIYTSSNYFARGLVLTHYNFLETLDLAENGAATSVYVYLDSVKNISAERDKLSAELAKNGFITGKPASDSEAISAVSAASPKFEEDREGRDRVMLTLATIDEVLGLVRTVIAAVNGVGAFIAAVMLFVIAVSIFINLKMAVSERLREIGTMRAVGVEAGDVTSLFMFESVLLSLLFSAAGALFAVLVSLVVRFGFTFPSDGNLGLFLQNGHLVLAPDFFAAAGTCLVIGLFAALFSYFPARRGGKIPPVEALTKTF